ncbi:Uu.00g068940.m01.CDS01 [Anthostomella pinea]|uniref:Uu.00g068940.m01.CDS01 n=1 Tax=Anthostomella pinea TaxID=933095 RepID=A0AAI8YNE3_9PEZI|nr:Uu.00g068940.m01.CDS01 [Anthostomella pinea]
MLISALLTSLLPATLALALPTSHSTRQTTDLPEFDITALSGTLPEGGPYGTSPSLTSSLIITVTYPSPADAATRLTTTCSTQWPATAPGPTDWATCADGALQWRLPEKGWTSDLNFRVEVYLATGDDVAGPGLDATHYLDQNPGDTSDPSAYLSCIQMGKFTPLTCQINGPLSAHSGSVVMYASTETARPE